MLTDSNVTILDLYDYQSSSIDWCEPNYVYDENIVEYWNSISSLFISGCGIVGIYFYPNVTLLYASLIPIGITSCYFHGTLSLLGQLMDEISIFFAIMIGLRHVNIYIYEFCHPFILTLVNTAQFIIVCLFPEYNRIMFFIYGGMCVKLIDNMGHHINMSSVIKNDIHTAVGLFGASVIVWAIDYICLYHIYLHALWHILIGLTGFYLFKIFAKIK